MSTRLERKKYASRVACLEQQVLKNEINIAKVNYAIETTKESNRQLQQENQQIRQYLQELCHEVHNTRLIAKQSVLMWDRSHMLHSITSDVSLDRLSLIDAPDRI
jgi:regulator of replication initiation timing